MIVHELEVFKVKLGYLETDPFGTAQSLRSARLAGHHAHINRTQPKTYERGKLTVHARPTAFTPRVKCHGGFTQLRRSQPT